MAVVSTQENFLQTSNNPSSAFIKRKGTTDKGKDYEHLYLAHLILKLITDDTVKNFRISSNDDDYGAFDDVIAEIERTNGEEKIYAIQLKHIDGIKTLAKEALSTPSPKATFGILKYFKESKHVKQTETPIKFIILTNNRFTVSDNVEIPLGDDETHLVISRCDTENTINTCDTGKSYRFRSKLPGSKFDGFFDNFELYTDQANVDKIRVITSNEFQRLFACDDEIFEKYAKFIHDWSIPNGQKPKIDKPMIKQIVAMLLLSPYTKTLVFDDGNVAEETQLLQHAVSKFRVTVCGKSQETIVRKLWKDCRNRLPQDMGVLKRGAKKYQIIRPEVQSVKDLNDDECTKILWLMGVCPLIVTDNECVRTAVRLCQNMIVLLVDEHHSYDKSFSKLSDLLEFPDIFDSVVRKFRFSMQGKEKVALEELTQVDRSILDVVTTNELLLMVADKLTIGGKEETLPPCHVERRLSQNIVDHQTILRLENCAIFISSFKDTQNFNTRNLVKVDEKFFELGHRHTTGTIYVVEDDCHWVLFDTFCHTIGTSANNCHHFRHLNPNFEWIASRNDFTDIKPSLQTGHYVEEKSLQRYEFQRSVNIVCADPGMGKTTLMQSLKNHISSDVWTVLIYARNHSRHFRQHQDNLDEFRKYVFDQMKKKLGAFDVKIFKTMVERNLVRYIWDGLDEVSSRNLEAVVGVIRKLRDAGLQQWITSRYNMQKRLESEFRVPSVTLRQFDDEEQKWYIQKRLNCTNEEMTTIFDKMKKNIQLSSSSDVLGIPLQIFMITELFQKNMNKYLVVLDEDFTIADLYHYFVDEKFQVYNIGKENADDNNDLVYERIQNEKTERVDQYEKAAVTVYMPQEIVTQWRVECQRLLNELQNGKDRFGIITNTNDETFVEFVHNSFGEYFTALYLSKNLNQVPDTRSFFFEERYSNIRFFFDLMLAATKGHVAVLHRNVNLLEKCDDRDLQSKDKGGRNVLQLVSSWGLRCPNLDVKENDQGFEIDNKNDDMLKFRDGESSDHRTVLERLAKLCLPDQKDELFDMSSYSYASKSSSLLSLAILTFQSSSIPEDFRQKSTLVFFYCTIADYTQIFDTMEAPFVTTPHNSLPFLLTKTQSVKSLRKILNHSLYKQNFTQRGSDGLLYEASKDGNPEIVQLLIDNGSNLDARAIGLDDMLPIVTSAMNGHCQAIKVMIDNGADPNIKNARGSAAIHMACQYQHCDVVKLLIDSGAEIDRPDKTFGTPLHYCLENGNYEIAKMLCERGVDVNQRPTHLKVLAAKLRFQMVEKKYPKLAQLLLDYGFDLAPTLEEKVEGLKIRIKMVRYTLKQLKAGEVC